MAPGKLRKAIWAVKDQTTIGLARMSGGTSSVKVAVIKATCHDEHPPEDCHVSKILTLTSHSHVRTCVGSIARRLHRTRNWAVALKALMLVRRLLAGGGRAYEQEIFFAARRGARFFSMSDFQDTSGKSDTWDYSAFVRAYAMYMDERLEFRMRGRRRSTGGYLRRGEEEEEDEEEELGSRHGSESSPPVCEMRIERVFSRAYHLKQLLHRCLSCRPTGAAMHNRLVVVAVYPIVKESFQLYYDLTEVTATLVDRFMQLQVSEMVRVHEIFCSVSKQFDELDKFYEWCTAVRVVRPSDCPKVEKIPRKKLDMMDDFIHQKSDMLKMRFARSPVLEPEPEETRETEPQHKELVLVPPQGLLDVEEDKAEVKENIISREVVGDLLDLRGEESPSTEEQADKWALALFGEDFRETSTSPGEEFDWSTGSDWETALVQSASQLSSQKASFVGGFDTMTLDSMYQQSTNYSNGLTWVCEDPFAASVGIAPPVYVQMSEMERKQKVWAEEQLMWREYARYGMMQGQIGNPYAYATAAYTMG